jgi:hypothetical protein
MHYSNQFNPCILIELLIAQVTITLSVCLYVFKGIYDHFNLRSNYFLIATIEINFRPPHLSRSVLSPELMKALALGPMARRRWGALVPVGTTNLD